MPAKTLFSSLNHYVLIFILSLISALVRADDIWSYWDQSNDNNTATIDHTLWQDNLKTYLSSNHPSGIHLYDYQAVTTSDKQSLASYLNQMSKLDPRDYAKQEQKAYWINLYNALTVQLILDHYPTTSIRKLGDSFFSFGPWDDPAITVAGQTLTLNDIEHRILRPIWKDPRIHYAVNCASLSCPNLAATAFTSDNIEALLEEGAKAYINHSRGVSWEDEELVLSKIYHWYQADFGKEEKDVIQHLIRYASPELATRLKQYDEDHNGIDYRYDWSLNELRASK